MLSASENDSSDGVEQFLRPVTPSTMKLVRMGNLDEKFAEAFGGLRCRITKTRKEHTRFYMKLLRQCVEDFKSDAVKSSPKSAVPFIVSTSSDLTSPAYNISISGEDSENNDGLENVELTSPGTSKDVLVEGKDESISRPIKMEDVEEPASTELNVSKNSSTKPSKCPSCPKTFAHHCSMRRHQRSHGKHRRSSGHDDGIGDTSATNAVHKRVKDRTIVDGSSATTLAIYQCDKCAYSTNKLRALYGHGAIHSSRRKKSWGSPVKSKRSEISDETESHRKHANSKPMATCPFCPMICSSVRILGDHLLRHDAKPPGIHSCDTCTFSTDFDHMIKEHNAFHASTSPIDWQT